MNHLRSGDSPKRGDSHHLNILLVHRENPAESELLRELVHRRDALVTWERDLRRARLALASNQFDVVPTVPESH